MKFTSIAWAVVSGTGAFDEKIVDALHDYPSEPSKFERADSIVRASFAASRNAQAGLPRAGGSDPVEEWARAFWSECWKIAPCMPFEVTSAGASAENGEETSDEPDWGEELLSPAEKAADEISLLFNGFIDAVFASAIEVDLYDPARMEVAVGLASRAARAAVAYARNTELWATEHSASVLRLFAETEILLRWMDLQGEESFKQYQQYGAGKRKLARIHLERLAEARGDAAPEEIRLAIKDQREKEGDSAIDTQEVNLESTFAGKSLRQMAIECGALDLYRDIYQSASSIVHGEWWTIQDYAMQRCMNPLHRFHEMPSLSAASRT